MGQWQPQLQKQASRKHVVPESERMMPALEILDPVDCVGAARSLRFQAVLPFLLRLQTV
eukprot:SAG31_NODE_2046_length_6572_cov_5.058396_4_plen_59_part_00